MNKKLLTLLISSFFISSALAESVLYKYNDSKGRTIYSDSVPASEKGQVNILSSKTMALKKINEKQLTSQEVEEKSIVEKEQKNILELSEIVKQKDQALLANYSSVDDIEKLKQYELQQINRAIQNDKDVLSTLKDRITALENKSKQNSGKVLPKDDIELKAIQQNYSSLTTNLEKNKVLYDSRDKKYNEDKARYSTILSKMAKIN